LGGGFVFPILWSRGPEGPPPRLCLLCLAGWLVLGPTHPRTRGPRRFDPRGRRC